MMKLTLKIDIPEIKEVECPTEYETPIGCVEHEQQARVIVSVLQYLQRLEDIKFLINSNLHHVLHPFCREIVRSRLDFVSENNIYYVSDKLSRLLVGFREEVGYNFQDEKFTVKVNSTGKKFKFDKYLHTFNTKEEAVSWFIDVAVSNKDYVIEE